MNIKKEKVNIKKQVNSSKFKKEKTQSTDTKMSDLSSLDTEYAIDPMDEDVVCFFCKHLPFQPKEITCKCALIGLF